jgi:MAGUK p55 subfamily member 5
MIFFYSNYSNFVYFISKKKKENDLLDIIDKGREIEEIYGHYFDQIIRNNDMDATYEELFQTINSVQNEENWVPINWLKLKN